MPGSKSITNRALILAALADGEVTLEGALWSEDTQVMVEALHTLGIRVEVMPDPDEPCNRTIIVHGLGGQAPHGGTRQQPLELFVGNAGTTFRFLTAAASLAVGEVSPIVETEFGYHVIKQEERKPAEQQSYESVKEQVKARCLQATQQERLNALRELSSGKGGISNAVTAIAAAYWAHSPVVVITSLPSLTPFTPMSSSAIGAAVRQVLLDPLEVRDVVRNAAGADDLARVVGRVLHRRAPRPLLARRRLHQRPVDLADGLLPLRGAGRCGGAPCRAGGGWPGSCPGSRRSCTNPRRPAGWPARPLGCATRGRARPPRRRA